MITKPRRFVHGAATLLGVVALFGLPPGAAVRRPLPGVSFRLSLLLQTVARVPNDTARWHVLSTAQVFGGQYAGGRERLDVEGTGGRSLGTNSYLLVDSASTRLVDPARRRRVSDTTLALDALATLDRLAAARVPVTGLSVRFDSLPADAPTIVGDTAGPALVSVNGRPVHRYRVTMQWNMPGAGKPAAMWQQTEYWVADFPINPINPYTAEHDALVGGSFGAELRALRGKLAVLATGTVIKVVCTTRSSVPGVEPVEEVRIVDLKAVRAATIEDSVFRVPNISGG